MMNFSGKIKIIFNKSKSQIYDFDSIRIESNCITTDIAKNILRY